MVGCCVMGTARSLSIQWGIRRTVTGFNPKEQAKRVLDMKAFVAELLGTMMLCTVGCGAAMAYGPVNGPTRLVVAFAFGISVLSIAYSVGHHSGGQLNPAVTLSLVLGKAVPWYQGLLNFVAQMIGSLLAGGLLCVIYPCEADLTTNLASNMASPGYTDVQCVIAEAMGTFMLCFTVWENAVTPISSCGKNACIAIGMAVFVGVLTLLPVTGCSINPARSFGPAVVASLRGCDNYTAGGLDDLWIMFVGPFLGAAVAALAHRPFVPSQSEIDFKKNGGAQTAPPPPENPPPGVSRVMDL
ncbi:Aquaporin AQPAe.a [Symbiodinium microadriaticum]|uniref:Aquaporin AQPAe.a n=1 Tax=Symbiodinium microadriaticum TaxID=2951 RepID=A0A1Q9E7B2_SYMMI|nr:Aquaporin AQPAe.a [Symbiodinium microadriaticum]